MWTSNKDLTDQQKKKSTVNCTKRDLKILFKWLVHTEELRSIENIPPPQLDAYLSEFYRQQFEKGVWAGENVFCTSSNMNS